MAPWGRTEALVAGRHGHHQLGVPQLRWVDIDAACQPQAGAREGRTAEQDVLRCVGLFAADGALRRWAPLVWALRTRRIGVSSDAVEVLDGATPVSRPHLVYGNHTVSVLAGDGERQPTPEDLPEERVWPLFLPALGRGSAHRPGECSDVRWYLFQGKGGRLLC